MVVVHRISAAIASQRIRDAWGTHLHGSPPPLLTDSAEDTARFFTDPIYGYGWSVCPYAFLVQPTGVVQQAVPVTIITPHARRWNRQAIGVGVVGESAPAHVPQFDALVELVDALVAAYVRMWVGPPAGLYGHDELLDSSADTGKQCPYPVVSMAELRNAVRVRRSAAGRSDLLRLGAVI